MVLISKFILRSAVTITALFFCSINTYSQSNNLAKLNAYYSNQNFNALINTVNSVKLKKGDSKLDLAFFGGVSRFHQAAYRGALDTFLKIFLTDRNEFDAIYFTKSDTRVYIGLCYLELAQYDSCLFYLVALEREGLPVHAHRAIAKSYFEVGKYEDALTKYSGILAMDSTFTEAYINRGFIYHNDKVYEEAIKEFNKAIELDDNLGNVYYGRALSKIALKDFSACEDLKKAIVLNYEKANTIYEKLCK